MLYTNPGQLRNSYHGWLPRFTNVLDVGLYWMMGLKDTPLAWFTVEDGSDGRIVGLDC